MLQLSKQNYIKPEQTNAWNCNAILLPHHPAHHPFTHISCYENPHSLLTLNQSRRTESSNTENTGLGRAINSCKLLQLLAFCFLCLFTRLHIPAWRKLFMGVPFRILQRQQRLVTLHTWRQQQNLLIDVSDDGLEMKRKVREQVRGWDTLTTHEEKEGESCRWRPWDAVESSKKKCYVIVLKNIPTMVSASLYSLLLKTGESFIAESSLVDLRTKQAVNKLFPQQESLPCFISWFLILFDFWYALSTSPATPHHKHPDQLVAL